MGISYSNEKKLLFGRELSKQDLLEVNPIQFDMLRTAIKKWDKYDIDSVYCEMEAKLINNLLYCEYDVLVGSENYSLHIIAVSDSITISEVYEFLKLLPDDCEGLFVTRQNCVISNRIANLLDDQKVQWIKLDKDFETYISKQEQKAI